MNRKEHMKEKLEAVILSSYEAMYRTAFVYLRQEEDAMDVVQESIVKAMRQVECVREPEFLKTWLFRIVINTAMDEQKRRKRILSLTEEMEEGREDIYQDMDLHQVLDKLSRQERAVITLRYFEEWQLEDIAKVLDKNLSTVKSLLYRSLKKMRIQLEEGGDPL